MPIAKIPLEHQVIIRRVDCLDDNPKPLYQVVFKGPELKGIPYRQTYTICTLEEIPQHIALWLAP